MFTEGTNQERCSHLYRLLYNQMSDPLVVRRENAALTHEAWTSIQPEESPPGGQERECKCFISFTLQNRRLLLKQSMI